MKNEYISVGAEPYKNLNLYESLRGTAVRILNRIDRTDAYLDRILELELKDSDLKGKDKALLFEIVHGVVRWLGRLDWVLTGFYKGQFSKCIPNVKNSMRVALYQILFLDKVPNYAAVNESVEFVKKIQGKKAADLTNAVLRNIIRSKDGIRYPDRETEKINFLSAYYSHPVWLVKRWMNQFNESFTEELMKSNNQRPRLTLRINNINTNKNELFNLLKDVKLRYEHCKYLNNYVHLKSLTNIADWDYFQKGYFAIQDESTGFSCRLLDPKPGMRVLDICAAPGGKTAYLAELMHNKGEITALEKYEVRSKVLQSNLERLGVTNVKPVVVDALDYTDEKGFDKILADVPCSGLGTITKKPDIKWKRYLNDIYKLMKLQTRLLENSAKLLKVGGELVYSTCSIDKEENFEIVAKFLEKNSNFELVSAEDLFDPNLLDGNGCIQTYPHIHNIDGAFAAKIRRIE